MPQKITYFAIVDDEASRENPAGIARRTEDEDGSFVDEGLHIDFAWHRTPIIVEWKRAESTDDLVEVTAEEAERIIEQFRTRWASAG
ncbi:MAG: hypothetical protein ABJB47_01445 [Actinomycetota bacterium]